LPFVRAGRAVQRMNVDFPVDLLRDIDQEGRRLGVTRQAFIKVRLADALAKAAATNQMCLRNNSRTPRQQRRGQHVSEFGRQLHHAGQPPLERPPEHLRITPPALVPGSWPSAWP
jgi:hypothetical protein